MPLALTATSDVQTLNQTLDDRQVAAEPFVYAFGGVDRFGVVWQSVEGLNPDLVVRSLSVGGVVLGDQAQVLSDRGSDQTDPEVAVLAGGEIAIAWTQETSDGLQIWGAFAQAGDATATHPFGDLSGTPLLVAPRGADYQNAQMTALSNGGFVLTADSVAGNPDNPTFVQGTIDVRAADGTLVGTTRGALAAGDFFGSTPTGELARGEILGLVTEVALDDSLEFGIEANVQAQIYDNTGRLDGAPSNISGDEFAGEAQLVRLADGRLVGAAELIEPDTGDVSLVMGSFDIYGAAQNDLVALSDGDRVGNESVALAATPDGGFVAVWETFSAGGARVVIRRFDVDLNPLGDSDFVSAGGGIIEEIDPQVAITDAGEVLVTWTAIDFAGDSEEDIQARTFTLDDLSTTGLTRTGTGLRDILVGTSGADTLEGGGGRDVLDGGAGADVLRGGLGNDLYIIDTRGDVIEGEIGFSLGGGIDTIRTFVSYTQPTNVELMRLGDEADTDNLNGIGNDAPGTIVGNAGDNRLTGRGGDDKLRGNDGDDVLIGNTGQDTLSGGRGSDTFVYTGYSESRAGRDTRDFINGFDRGRINDDVIDLSGLDAITSNGIGDDAFTFIGKAAFSGTAGELRAKDITGQNALIISGDHNGDGVADFQIFVNQTNFMTGSDFIL